MRRRDTRPAGELPDFDNPRSTQPTSFGNPPGFGASKTGFVSTNTKRRPPAGLRKGIRAQPKQGTTQAGAALAHAARRQRDDRLAGTTATTTKAGARSTTHQARDPPPPAPTQPPRNPLVRIPDGTPTGGVAGTVNTAQMTTAQATLLRRRTAAEEDAFAQLGLRTGAFLVSPAVEVIGGYDTNPARTPGGPRLAAS